MFSKLCIVKLFDIHFFSLLVSFKDGRVTTINHVDENVRNVLVPEDMLDSIYVGRCFSDTEYCSIHNGSFTDVNIWNRAFSINEMIRWTNCRQVTLISHLFQG